MLISSPPFHPSPSPLISDSPPPPLSTQHFCSALIPPPGSPLLTLLFRLSDLSCGSRGLICSPNILNCSRAKAYKYRRKRGRRGGGEKKDPRTFSTISWASECVAVASHLVCYYGEERCVCTFQKEVSAQDQFSTPSLKCHNDFFTILPPSHPPRFYARCEFHQRSIKASNAQQPTGTNYQLDSRIIHPWSWVEQGGAAALNM